jgi:mannose-6-phosphate isomerase-like protein (cupin superfamily)
MTHLYVPSRRWFLGLTGALGLSVAAATLSALPSSTKEAGSRPIILGPGEGRVIPGPEGLTLKASGADTGGAIGLLEGATPPGFGPPRHIHHRSDELFYVLDGDFQFLVGEQMVSATAGSFVFIPRGTVHAPKIVGDRPGRAIVAFVPGGEERAFDEFAELAAAQGGVPDFTGEAVQAIARKYGAEFVGPPL